MKLRFHSLFLTLLTLCCLILAGLPTAQTARAAKPFVFTVGFDAEFPPYGFQNEDGEYDGFDLELAEEVCKRQGWKLKKQPIDWDSKDMELNSGTITCIWNGFTINGREKSYTWSRAYIDNSQVVIVKNDSDIQKLSDLAGKVVVVQADSSALAAFTGDDATKENKKLCKSFADLQQVGDYNSAFMNLESGSVDAICMDIGVAAYQVKQRGDTFRLLDEHVSSEQYGIGFKKGNTKIRNQVQASLDEMLADGTFQKIAEKWELTDCICLGKPDTDAAYLQDADAAPIPAEGLPGSDISGSDKDSKPSDDEQADGSDNSSTGNSNDGSTGNGQTLTEDEGSDAATADGSGNQSTQDNSGKLSLGQNIIRVSGKLGKGMLATLLIFVLTLVFSLPLGLLLCMIRKSRFKLLQWLARIYISIMRGTPLMLQLLVVFFGPYYVFGTSVSSKFRFYAVIIGFSLNYAAYFAEIYRSGIEGIPNGQREAATLLGYTKTQTFWRIIFPQMVKRVLPPVTNEVITLVKDTSLAFALAYTEMFTVAKQVAAADASILPLFVAGLFYYIFNFLVAMGMERLEKAMSYYEI